MQWSFKTVLENETSPDKWRKSALDPTFQEKKKRSDFQRLTTKVYSMVSHRAKVWKSVVLARVYPVPSKMPFALRLLVESS